MTAAQPVPGPRWTQGRFVDMLTSCYGRTDKGHIHITAVAEYAQVKPATVRRWIGGAKRDRRRRTLCPGRRIAQLQRGPAIVERRNEQQYDRALAAIATINSGGEILPEWEKEGWLEPHIVVIGAVHGKPWLQVAVTNGTRRALTFLLRRLTAVASIEVPTWFHGQVLAHAVMTRQSAWRVHPAKTELDVGRTLVWMDDAPLPDLAALIDTQDLWHPVTEV